MNNTALSPIVRSIFPEYIRDTYPMFMTFVEAYYKFMEEDYNSAQNVLQNALDYIDIDKTLDIFLPRFLRTHPEGIPALIQVDRRLLAKVMFQIYQTKGSEPSFRLLFQLLYGEQVEISYPKNQLLRTSAGKWNQDQSIQIVVQSGSINDIVGRIVYSKNASGLVTANAIRYTQLNSSVYELFLSNISPNTTFQISDSLYAKGTAFVGVIQPTIVAYSIVRGGKNFRVGQIFDVVNVTGSGSKVKVTQVDVNGAIKKLTIIGFGTGYITDFYASLVAQIAQTGVTSPFASYTHGFIEDGLITRDSGYYASNYVDPSYTGLVLGTFGDNQYIPDAGAYDDTKSAIILMKLGALSKYQGYYSSVDGFLSDSIVLQDGFLYQDFSYLIRSSIPVSEYRESVQKILHPAGTKMFGEYQITNSLDLGVFFEAERDIIEFENIKDTVSLLDLLAVLTTKSFADFIASPTDIITLSTGKVFGDNVTSVDSYKTNFGKSVQDSIISADITSKAMTKCLTGDSIISADSLTKQMSRISLDNVLSGDSISKTTTKSFSLDAVTSSDSNIIKTTKVFSDTTLSVDIKNISTGKVFSETQTVFDLVGKNNGKIVLESVISGDIISKTMSTTMSNDYATMADVSVRSTNKAISDISTTADSISKSTSRTLAVDNAISSDSIAKTQSKTFSDNTTSADSITKSMTTSIAVNYALPIDLMVRTTTKAITDISTATDSLSKTTTRSVSVDTVTSVDSLAKTYSKTFSDGVVIVDGAFVGTGEFISDSVINSDSGSIFLYNYTVDTTYFAADYIGSVLGTF